MEGIHKSEQSYKKSKEIFMMMYHTKDIIENAVPIVIHDDIYKGTRREDLDIAKVYVMLGAFKNGNNVYPVEIIAKERTVEKNTIRMEVVLNEIKDGVMGARTQKYEHNTPQPSSNTISIEELVSKVNPKHGDFLKYIPEKMLNDTQKEAAIKAQEEQNERVQKLKEETIDIRHSLSGTQTTENLIKENEHLKETVKTLQEEFQTTDGNLPNPVRIKSVCRKLLKKYHSTFDQETFEQNVTKLYEYMNQDNANYEDALKVTSEIARGVLEKSTFKDTSMYDTYKDLRNYFRTTKLALFEAQQSEVAYAYGSMSEFRKSNFGRLRITNEGTTLDQVWSELSEQYPELFDANTNDGDMITNEGYYR